MMASLDTLRELLKRERYPHRYTHKFIGRKTAAFAAAVDDLEAAFPQAERVLVRESGAGGKGARYVAYTYEILAQGPDDIIALLQATAALKDLHVIL